MKKKSFKQYTLDKILRRTEKMTSKKSKMLSARVRSRVKKKEKTDDEEMIEKEPRGSFAWKIFLPSQIKTLTSAESPEDLEDRMANALNLDQYDVDLREGAQVDYYVAAFHWAQQRSFDERQLGGFMGLLSTLLDNLKENNMPKVENIKYLKDCFSGVGLDNPEQIPISLYFFTLEQAKDVTEYLLTTFFQHYELYEYLFKIEQDELIIGSYLGVLVCPENAGPIPPPLEEGVTADVHDRFYLNKDGEKDAEQMDHDGDDETADDVTDAVMNAIQASDDDSVRQVAPDELRKVILKVTNEMILPAKREIKEKITEREQSYVAKISKVQVK